MQRSKPVLRGELALAIATVINGLGVDLMLHAGGGISAISSVPYAFSEVFPFLSLGTWAYIFQGTLVVALMFMRRRFVPSYLLSFVVGFCFGIMLDVHNLWVPLLPLNPVLRVVWFVLSYLLMCVGISICNCCKTPINPTDLFPREASELLHVPYARVKITFDLSCLATTAIITFVGLGYVKGLGVGTVVAALTVGKGVGFGTNLLRKHVEFVSIFEPGDRPTRPSRPAPAAV